MTEKRKSYTKPVLKKLGDPPERLTLAITISGNIYFAAAVQAFACGETIGEVIAHWAEIGAEMTSERNIEVQR